MSINKYLLYTVGKLLSYRITENYEISNVYVYVREKKTFVDNNKRITAYIITAIG